MTATLGVFGSLLLSSMCINADMGSSKGIKRTSLALLSAFDYNFSKNWAITSGFSYAAVMLALSMEKRADGLILMQVLSEAMWAGSNFFIDGLFSLSL